MCQFEAFIVTMVSAFLLRSFVSFYPVSLESTLKRRLLDNMDCECWVLKTADFFLSDRI